MDQKTYHYVSPSGQLKLHFDASSKIVTVWQGDMKAAGIDEYSNFITMVGDCLVQRATGKLLMDTSALCNYTIEIRSKGVNLFQNQVLNRVPYFVLGAVKGKSLFDNAGLTIAITVAKRLSSKFLDGKIFNTRDEAWQWLSAYKPVVV